MAMGTVFKFSRNRSPPFFLRFLLPVTLLLLAHLGCVDCSGSGQFTQVTVTSPYPPRFSHFAFAWAGAIWVAGGVNQFDQAQVDVWGSYDYGRTWQQSAFSNGTVANLPGLTCSEASRGIVYNDAVYLVSDCNTLGNPHGSAGYGSNDYWTYFSRDLALTSWTTLQDGCQGCYAFSVERMAVPFDGTGTLIMVNDIIDASVRWQSATGNFQSATVGGGTKNMWTPWSTSPSAAAYTAPWGVRGFSATATDAEGLVLIVTGGDEGGALLNDVWQLSWSSSFDAPLVYQVTASAGWEGRDVHLAVMVHDWLFIYGGYSAGASVSNRWDDAWMSGDYGATWKLYDSSATDGQGREYISGVTLGRRLFITGGGGPTAVLQDVYVSYW
jgi:hypothetical protein